MPFFNIGEMSAENDCLLSTVYLFLAWHARIMRVSFAQ